MGQIVIMHEPFSVHIIFACVFFFSLILFLYISYSQSHFICKCFKQIATATTTTFIIWYIMFCEMWERSRTKLTHLLQHPITYKRFFFHIHFGVFFVDDKNTHHKHTLRALGFAEKGRQFDQSNLQAFISLRRFFFIFQFLYCCCCCCVILSFSLH